METTMKKTEILGLTNKELAIIETALEQYIEGRSKTSELSLEIRVLHEKISKAFAVVVYSSGVYAS